MQRDRHRPSGRLLRQGDMDASYVDLADPTHLEFDYLRWARIVLAACRAHRILHIGGGGCALARALAAQDPDGRQEVCEVDGEVLAVAREHLGLRRAPGLRVRHAEGRAHLETQADDSWDAIVIDAFVGAIVPRRLVTVQGLGHAARVAALTLVNVVDDRRTREVRRVAAAMAGAYPQVWMLGGRTGNTLVAGSRTHVDLARVATQAAADPSPARLTAPAQAAELLDGAIALRDGEVEDSGDQPEEEQPA